MARFSLSYCEECGEARVPHLMFDMSHFVDAILLGSGFRGKTLRRMHQYFENLFLGILTPDRVLTLARRLSAVGIGTLQTQPTEKDNTRTKALYEGAEASKVTLYSYKWATVPVCFVAEKNVHGAMEQVIFDTIPRPKGFVSPSLPWLDDKGILKLKLIEANLPCAQGGVATNLKEAQTLFQSIGRPVITKPRSGSRGRHTSLDIRTEEELEKGFKIAQQLSRAVVIESYLKGVVHRVTLVGGEPVAVARRQYPHVVGDVKSTVRELIEIENQAPYRNGIHFRKIDTKHRIDQSLRKQSLTFESVPEFGRIVILNDKNSRLHGTLTEDVTDSVHPENNELFRTLGTMLGDPIVGVDFMIHDMSRSWKEQPDAGVIECNSMPFIDVHHRVVSGRQINVAEKLWNVVFASTPYTT